MHGLGTIQFCHLGVWVGRGGREIIVFAGVRYGELINSKLTWKKVPSQIVCKELIKNRDF